MSVLGKNFRELIYDTCYHHIIERMGPEFNINRNCF